MSNGKSLIYAAGITAVSVVGMIVTRGMPTVENLFYGSVTMFVVAFVVMKFFAASPTPVVKDGKGTFDGCDNF